MFKFFNTNPPQTRENTEKTLKRMEKINKALESVTTAMQWGGLGTSAALGVLVGGGTMGFIGLGIGAAAGVAVAVPAVTAALVVPVAAQNIVKSKIDSLRKKLANPIPHILGLQKQKTEKLAQEYQRVSQDGKSTIDSVKFAKKEFEEQEKREGIFVKAAERAKLEGKERTIGRLMNIVERAQSGNSVKSGLQTLMHGIYAAISIPIANNMFGHMKEHAQKMAERAELLATHPQGSAGWYIANSMDPNPPHSKIALVAAGAVAAVSVAATAYCAYQTVKYHKREKAADKAYTLLDNYVQGR